jgi:hypothetical protein
LHKDNNNNNNNKHNNKILISQTLFFIYKVHEASSDSELAVKQKSFISGAPLGYGIIPFKGPGLHSITKDTEGGNAQAHIHTHTHTHTPPAGI